MPQNAAPRVDTTGTRVLYDALLRTPFAGWRPHLTPHALPPATPPPRIAALHGRFIAVYLPHACRTTFSCVGGTPSRHLPRDAPYGALHGTTIPTLVPLYSLFPWRTVNIVTCLTAPPHRHLHYSIPYPSPPVLLLYSCYIPFAVFPKPLCTFAFAVGWDTPPSVLVAGWFRTAFSSFYYPPLLFGRFWHSSCLRTMDWVGLVRRSFGHWFACVAFPPYPNGLVYRWLFALIRFTRCHYRTLTPSHTTPPPRLLTFPYTFHSRSTRYRTPILPRAALPQFPRAHTLLRCVRLGPSPPAIH